MFSQTVPVYGTGAVLSRPARPARSSWRSCFTAISTPARNTVHTTLGPQSPLLADPLYLAARVMQGSCRVGVSPVEGVSPIRGREEGGEGERVGEVGGGLLLQLPHRLLHIALHSTAQHSTAPQCYQQRLQGRVLAVVVGQDQEGGEDRPPVLGTDLPPRPSVSYLTSCSAAVAGPLYRLL